LKENNDKEIEDRSAVHKNISKTILKTQKEIDSLTKMKIRELLTDEEYLEQKNELQKTQKKLREQLRDTEDRADKWLDITERMFNFAIYAKQTFEDGDYKTKKEILTSLGSNFILNNGKLEILAHPWLKPIEKANTSPSLTFDALLS